MRCVEFRPQLNTRRASFDKFTRTYLSARQTCKGFKVTVEGDLKLRLVPLKEFLSTLPDTFCPGGQIGRIVVHSEQSPLPLYPHKTKIVSDK